MQTKLMVVFIFLQVYVWHTRTENPKLLDGKNAKKTLTDLTVEV
jgi:hypothetical protein